MRERTRLLDAAEVVRDQQVVGVLWGGHDALSGAAVLRAQRVALVVDSSPGVVVGNGVPDDRGCAHGTVTDNPAGTPHRPEGRPVRGGPQVTMVVSSPFLRSLSGDVAWRPRVPVTGLVRHGLFIPNTNGSAGSSWLVTSPLREKIFSSTRSSSSGPPAVKSSSVMLTPTTLGA